MLAVSELPAASTAVTLCTKALGAVSKSLAAAAAPAAVGGVLPLASVWENGEAGGWGAGGAVVFAHPIHRVHVGHEGVGGGLEIVGRGGGPGGGEGDVAARVDLEEGVGAGVGAGGGEAEAGDRDVVAEGDGGEGGPGELVLGVAKGLVVHHRGQLVQVGDVEGDVGGVGVARRIHRGHVVHEGVGGGLEIVGRGGGPGGGEGDVAEGVDLEEGVGAGVGAGGGEAEAGDRDVVAEGDGGEGGPQICTSWPGS